MQGLDKYLTSGPEDLSWWFEAAFEYIPEGLFTEEEQELVENFLSDQVGKTPQQAAIALVKQFKGIDLPVLEAPQPQSEWYWLSKEHGNIRSVVLYYDEEIELVAVRPKMAERHVLTEREQEVRKLPLYRFHREYKKIQ